LPLVDSLPPNVPTRAIAPLLGVILTSALGSLAHAEPAHVSLAAPPACGSEAALRERIVELGAAEARAQVVVTAEENAYRLVVQLAGEVRELSDADCHALLEAAAVMIALDASAPPASVAQAPEIVPHVESIADRRDGPAPRPPRRAALHVPVWLELGGVYGVLPVLSGAFGLGVGLRGETLGARLAAHYLTPSETAGAPAVRAQGAQAALLFTAAPLRRFELGLGGRASLLHGRGTRVDRVHSAWLVAWSALLEARVTALERPRDQLGIVAGAGLALGRPHFQVKGQGSVYQPAALQASLGFFWARDFF
jgi:hypothetical protein